MPVDPRREGVLRRLLGAFTLVEALVAVAVVAIGLTSLFVLNTRCLRFLRRSKEAVIAGQVLQERIEQLRIINRWNSTNIISTNWLGGTNFLGSESRAAYLVAPTGNGTGTLGVGEFEEIITLNPVSVTNNSTVTVDTTTSLTVTKSRTSGGSSISSTSANAGNFTNSSLVRVRLQFRWLPFGGGTTNTVETATLFARGQ